MLSNKIIAILCITLTLPAYGQEKKANQHDTIPIYKSYQLSSGYINLGSVDQLYSQQVYSGGAPFLGFSFAKTKRIETQTTYRISRFNRYPTSLNLENSALGEDNRLRYINNIHFEVNDEYRFKLKKSLHPNLELFFTGTWFTSVDLTYNQNLMPELLLSTIAPGLFIRYNKTKSTFNLHVSSSLLSYTCRNNYAKTSIQDYEALSRFDFIKKNSRIELPHKLSTLLLTVDYTYTLSAKLELHSGYTFRYLHSATPRPLKSVIGIYTLGLAYTFTK